MTREKFESYLGKNVEVEFFDGSTYIGKIEVGNGFFVNERLKNKDYIIINEDYTRRNVCFKLSHIVRIKEVLK